jgi:hypothetical protein
MLPQLSTPWPTAGAQGRFFPLADISINRRVMRVEKIQAQYFQNV